MAEEKAGAFIESDTELSPEEAMKRDLLIWMGYEGQVLETEVLCFSGMDSDFELQIRDRLISEGARIELGSFGCWIYNLSPEISTEAQGATPSEAFLKCAYQFLRKMKEAGK